MTKNSNSSVCGIYEIRNVETNEMYVGSSRRVYERLYDHMVDLSRGTHTNKLLQKSWDTSHPSVFSFSVLEIMDDEDLLLAREVFWIKRLSAVEDGFNTKSDRHKRRALMKIHPETNEELEDLDMGSMNSTLAQLLKYYKKHH